MFRLIYRQKRRLLFTAFFGALALMMMASRFGAGFNMVSEFPLFMAAALFITFASLMIAIMLASAVVIVLLPDWRAMLETAAL